MKIVTSRMMSTFSLSRFKDFEFFVEFGMVMELFTEFTEVQNQSSGRRDINLDR